jgi:flagellar basal-body rod protein FlgG
MFDALYIGATGMRAQQAQVDTVANNVANLSTTGFKRSTVSFQDVMAALSPMGVDAIDAAGRLARGAGALASTALSTAAGTLMHTSQPLDVAIDGNGFLEVIRADGSPAYTRAGSLVINADGQLALADGTPLSGRFFVPPDMTAMQISADGKVTATVSGATQPIEVGQIELASFANPGALQPLGGNLFAASESAGPVRTGTPSQEGLGSIRQGYLESSNVQLVEELTSMMLAQRGFELNSRVVQAADQMMALTNGLYRN